MAQIKIYGYKTFLAQSKQLLSDTIHTCSIQALGLPQEKRFHRFISMEKEAFIHPADRSEKYIIIEILLIEGRTVETRKKYLKQLMSSLSENCNVPINDIEITLIESPKENWGIRGQTADELKLNYKIEK